MVSTKFFSVLASTTVFIGVVNAFTGTANLGFFDTVFCETLLCPSTELVAIPPTLVGSAACCTPVTLHYKNKTITALYTATYNGAGGPDNMALSPAAFAGLEDTPSDTSLSPVTWSFV
ncbi:hypothetical protein B0H13DRAFT_2105949 [Mycena leptocephala]|nr:hypothetical protein B0H13DRAFT_2105949 [Mycena leptocephala]